MADLFDKVKAFTRPKEARELGIYPFFQALQNSEGTTATFNGHEVVMIGSNNYLGLTTHPKVRQAAMDAIALYGTSCTGSRFLNGTLELHLELERRLARFMNAEAALTFTTGYQANVGTITALVGRGDYVIIDKEDHASIVDGCMMCMGELRRFSHNDPQSLENMLSRVPDTAGKLVVVDGVYSMGGDIAPLPELVRICKKYGARIMVAHRTNRNAANCNTPSVLITQPRRRSRYACGAATGCFASKEDGITPPPGRGALGQSTVVAVMVRRHDRTNLPGRVPRDHT